MADLTCQAFAVEEALATLDNALTRGRQLDWSRK